MNAHKNRSMIVVLLLGLLALVLAGCAALGNEMAPAASAAGAEKSFAYAPNRLLKVYAAPDAGAGIIDVLTPSQKPLDIHGRSADSRWLAVELSSGHGWIPVSELNPGSIDSLPVVDSNERAGAPMTAAAGTLVKVYGGPGTGHGVVGLLMTYQEVQVTGRSADSRWLAVELPDGQGWIPAGEVSSEGIESLAVLSADEPASAAGAMTATAGTLVKVYAGPGTGHGVLGLLMTYQETQVIGRSVDGDWLAVAGSQADAAPAGWISAGEVELSGELADLPILSAA